MKLPEFNLFCDKSARIFLIFPSICPNFHGFPKFWGAAPLSRTPMGVNSRAELVPSPRAYARKGALGDDCFLC